MNDYTQPFRLVHGLVDSINQASGASSQLVHHLQDHRFMIIRDALELMKEGLLKIAPHNELVRGMARA